MISALIKRPIAVFTIIGTLVISGFACLPFLPVSLLPMISIPRIIVDVDYPGMGALEIENQVVRYLREEFRQIHQLDRVESKSGDGKGYIYLDFKYGTDLSRLIFQVNEMVDRFMPFLPAEVARPNIVKTSLADIPVFKVNFFFRDKKENEHHLQLSQYVKSNLKKRLEVLPGVAFVDINGVEEAEAFVIPNLDRMRALGLEEKDIENLIEENNIDFGNILVLSGNYQYHLKLGSNLRSVNDLENLAFNQNGTIFRLKEIADIKLGKKQRGGKYFWNGEKAIELTIRKHADAQLYYLKKEVARVLDDVISKNPSLAYSISADSADLLNISIENLKTSLFYGVLFAIIISILVFKNWKLSLGIVLPVLMSIPVSLFFIFCLKMTLNVISLGGLILGAGMMIDNSIILIDNIQNHENLGAKLFDACLLGTNEVIIPLLSSILTTCSVFLPLVLVKGIAGVLFYDQAISVSIALGVSFVICCTFIPTFYFILGGTPKNKTLPAKGNRPMSFLFSCQGKTMKWQTLGLVAFLFSIYPLLNLIQLDTFPKLTRTSAIIDINWKTYCSDEDQIQHLSKFLKNQSGWIGDYSIQLGEPQFMIKSNFEYLNHCKVDVSIKSDFQKFALGVKEYFHTNHPGADVSITFQKNPLDEVAFNQKPPVLLKFFSNNRDTLPDLKLIQPLIDCLNREKVKLIIPELIPEYHVEILSEKSLQYGVAPSKIIEALSNAFKNKEISAINYLQEKMSIVFLKRELTMGNALNAVKVKNLSGINLPVSHFIRLKSSSQYRFINGDEEGISLNILVSEFNQELINEVKKIAQNIPDIKMVVDGQFVENQKLIKELTWILLLGCMLLYLILVLQFESFVQPLIVLTLIPIGICGAMAFLWFFDQSLNLISFTGLVVLSGIAVNDAILKVDTINRFSANYPLADAIELAGQKRLRPILMTSLTTILALIPILFSKGLGAELQQPLVFVLVGGLLASTFGSIFFLPVLYQIFTVKRSKQ